MQKLRPFLKAGFCEAARSALARRAIARSATAEVRALKSAALSRRVWNVEVEFSHLRSGGESLRKCDGFAVSDG
jgi:hypothetical protein